MKIATEPQSFSAEVHPTLPLDLDRITPRSTPLRRALVLVLLVLSFALALVVMNRARHEMLLQQAAAPETHVTHVDYTP
jgi:hypothetical protein